MQGKLTTTNKNKQTKKQVQKPQEPGQLREQMNQLQLFSVLVSLLHNLLGERI
jgi:hypothetical protein